MKWQAAESIGKVKFIYMKDENDEYHNDNGPALFYEDYTNAYFTHGVCHRIGGPARYYYFNWSEQLEEWWVDGKLHREDGPAKIYYVRLMGIFRYKIYMYYLNDVEITKERLEEAGIPLNFERWKHEHFIIFKLMS